VRFVGWEKVDIDGRVAMMAARGRRMGGRGEIGVWTEREGVAVAGGTGVGMSWVGEEGRVVLVVVEANEGAEGLFLSLQCKKSVKM
jgi:hypothetical protein